MNISRLLSTKHILRSVAISTWLSVSSMFNSLASFARVDIKYNDFLGVARINQCNHVGSNGEVSLAEEFNTKALHNRFADELAFITVNIEVLRSINDGEEFSTLNNHVDIVLQVEYEGR
jgi:hypothetical protein